MYSLDLLFFIDGSFHVINDQPVSADTPDNGLPVLSGAINEIWSYLSIPQSSTGNTI